MRELHAITEAVAKFRHYLFGHFFIIQIDQKSLKHLAEQTIQTPKQEAWLPKLLGYNYIIEYKLGKNNQVADTLSRSCYMALSEVIPILTNILEAELKNSTVVQNLISKWEANLGVMPEYSIRQGLLYWRNRLYILAELKSIVRQLMELYHASPVGGHTSLHRTHARIATHFF